MKRLLATMILLVAWASIASAGNYDNTARWTYTDLKSIQTQVPAVGDSGTVCGATARLDTTTAFPIWDAHQGIASIPRAGTAVDTTDWIVFQAIPTNREVTVSADSIYLQTQVSMDGITWALVTPTILYQVANTVNPYGTGGIVLEAVSTNSFARSYKLAWAATGQHQTAFQATAPTDNQLWGWNFVRFIVGQANDGCYQFRVWHWTIAN